MTDRSRYPKTKNYIDPRFSKVTTNKCTYRVDEGKETVTITVSPKGKDMVTHRVLIKPEQFDEMWFMEFRERFENDVPYQRRFRVPRKPQPRDGRERRPGPPRGRGGPNRGPQRRNDARPSRDPNRRDDSRPRNPNSRSNNQGANRSRNANSRMPENEISSHPRGTRHF